MTTLNFIGGRWKEVPGVFRKMAQDASGSHFHAREWRSYKDAPRGPTLKVERGRRGLESLFESSGMVSTRRHWVHLQILEERRGRRRK